MTLQNAERHKASLAVDWEQVLPELPSNVRMLGKGNVQLLERHAYGLLIVNLQKGEELDPVVLKSLARLCRTAVVTVWILWMDSPNVPWEMQIIGHGGVSDRERFDRKKFTRKARAWWTKADASKKAEARVPDTAQIVTSTRLIEGDLPKDEPLPSDLTADDHRLDFEIFRGKHNCFPEKVHPVDIDCLLVSDRGWMLAVERKRAVQNPSQDESLSDGQKMALQQLGKAGVIDILVVWFNDQQPVRMLGYDRNGGFLRRDCDLADFQHQVLSWAEAGASIIPNFYCLVQHSPASMISYFLSHLIVEAEGTSTSEDRFWEAYCDCCRATGVQSEAREVFCERLAERLYVLGGTPGPGDGPKVWKGVGNRTVKTAVSRSQK